MADVPPRHPMKERSYIIRILCFADGRKSSIDGQWLKSYDPEAFEGRGDIRTTRNPELALRCKSFAQATELWKAPSRWRPLRPDGQANRPLSAFTIEIEPWSS